MLNVISTVSSASTILNFTDDLSVLVFGLIGLTWLSAGMIVASALRDSFRRKAKLTSATPTHVVDYRLAA